MKVLIVGADEPTHIGRIFVKAGAALGLDAQILNSKTAFSGSRLLSALTWRVARRPLRLEAFSQMFLNRVHEFQPNIVISTGNAPILARTLHVLRGKVFKLVNFSTDDPWNPSSKSAWFMNALRAYDTVFTPRRSTIDELRHHGCSDVRWLPFAFDPDVHYPETSSEKAFMSDVAFVGGADQERVALFEKLIRTGLNVGLWGGYWDHFASTRRHARGLADTSTMRKVLSNTHCALTLVRRSNRDGHCMRTFEVAAMGSPVLAECTSEHQEILGEEGDTALFFRTEQELIEKAVWLVEHSAEGQQMGWRLRKRLVNAPNTYEDRLKALIS